MVAINFEGLSVSKVSTRFIGKQGEYLGQEAFLFFFNLNMDFIGGNEGYLHSRKKCRKQQRKNDDDYGGIQCYC